MLANLLVITSLVAPQDPPPTSGMLSEQPFVVLPVGGTDLKYWEVDIYQNLQDVDPRYTLANIVSLPGDLEFGSFSRGTGWMHTVAQSSSGQISAVQPVVQDGWSYFTFTVSGTSFPAGSAFDDEFVAGGDVTGDVFAYVLPGSEGFPDDQQGVVHKVREGEEIPGGPISYVDIDGFLGGMAMTDDFAEEFDDTASSSRVSFYFTVTSPSGDYSQIPLGWVRNDPDLRSPATIFRTTYEQGAWNAPEMWKSWQDLGLTSTEVITAISVMDSSMRTNNVGPEVLLSVDSTDPDRMLWIVGTWVIATLPVNWSGPLGSESGSTFAAAELGLDPALHRIRGACGDDPYTNKSSTNFSHDIWRRERQGFLEQGSVASSDLVWSLHRQWVRTNLPIVTFRASMIGPSASNQRQAELQMRDGSGWLSMGTVQADPGEKATLLFDLPILGGGLTDAIFRWRSLGSGGAVLGDSELFVIRRP
ncbi:MAG: hypothetical protein KAI24_15765 [Planctomycetes bacterium]|nr:hypothetical protein [Planctomycetota bacterium]